MQTLRKKTSPCKYRNDPGRFFGDGVTFKAKLIGILEVGEARGDRMCQEALQDLKMAIRAAGEHKQRITIHVTIDGLRLRDEKTGDSLYHHPVHKISFIAQDMSDSRAFGYIFGSPDSGHRFFGIKTDKAASQVVLAMRDLFQVVFELKKKEIEMARQQIQSKTIHEHQPLALSVKNISSNDTGASGTSKITNDIGKQTKEMSPESVADLVDLEQELTSIQRGITQMERITPSEPTAPVAKSISEEDPFGDSFTSFPTYNLLPPPESTRSRKANKQSDSLVATESQISSFASSSHSSATIVSTGGATNLNISSGSNTLTGNNWLEHDDIVAQFEPTKSLESNASTGASISQISEDIQPQKTGEDLSKIQSSTTMTTTTTTGSQSSTTTKYIDAFTDLDPLGTGKSKPYVDKKYFFQELKNPPKKVLKDLSGPDGSFPATFSGIDNSDMENFMISENPIDSQFDISKSQNSVENGKLNDFQTRNISSTTMTSGSSVGNSSNFNQTGLFSAQQIKSHNDKIFNIDLERTKTLDEPIMMPRDTDPFSPTRKKSDPFQDGDIFSKLDPFEFEITAKSSPSMSGSNTSDTKLTNDDLLKYKKDPSVFNGPLQVNLPPESWSSGQKRMERQTSESPTSGSRARPSVFKQNTVDVISSISSKKMPHLFGQKFSKRDSNSINMRRLQESDSLSENEAAPEPPPRPESATYIEPPPLPPKKQFSDIVIRPRITSSSAIPPSIRYDYVTSKMKSSSQQSMSDFAPPIPLPSRKIGRTDTSFPGPGRPRKPGEEDDYLTPITVSSDVPPLLPPPQAKGRGRRTEHGLSSESKTDNNDLQSSLAASSSSIENQPQSILPDITLSQLLTLGIDELATKLNVPTTKLSTMTLVELTSYLSEFIENSKKKQIVPKQVQEPLDDVPVFKVNFDQNPDAMFVAKFDDNFGEESNVPFVANFSNFDVQPEQPTKSNIKANVPPADRYAVLREIIEQEMKTESTSEMESFENDEMNNDEEMETREETETESEGKYDNKTSVSTYKLPKIDTKITEAISHAKDRYAALRDIILVEDLFEKSSQPLMTMSSIDETVPTSESTDTIRDQHEDDEMDTEQLKDERDIEEQNAEIIKDGELIEMKKTPSSRGIFSHTVTPAPETGTNKDDLEIDELMNRAISNISLESREHLSPSQNKSPSMNGNTSTSPGIINQTEKVAISQIQAKSQFSDVSTSPIPQQKSPAPQKSPLSKSPTSRSPNPQSPAVTNLVDNNNKRNTSGSLSDAVCISSPDAEGGRTSTGASEKMNKKQDISSIVGSAPTPASGDSWAVFDTKPEDEKQEPAKSPKTPKDVGESPCSSDGKDEWRGGEQEYGKRWPKGHTSSSSRDLSPWDDEAPDYRKRIPPGATDRQGYYMRHARRMNSCDDDYEYEEEMAKRREKKLKATSRSRENFETDPQGWYSSNNPHSWSPGDEEGRPRQFERSAYERSTYGPPYLDKREHKGALSYDRREYKNYDKRKYYREYSRPEYDFEPYDESSDTKDRKVMYYDTFEKPKSRRDYENIYEEGFSGSRDGRPCKQRGEYFYERDKRSFDRDSVESYESGGRRHKSFGSGDLYGSLDSREEFRERYMNSDRTRSLRKGMKIRGNEEYEQDSETEIQSGRRSTCGPGDTKSLQRPPQNIRVRKSSGSSPWDGEEPPSTGNQKGWKRPASASESERRMAENRRVLCHTLSGSDGEKERRFRRKQRFKGKEMEQPGRQQTCPSGRYPSHRDPNYMDYMDYEDYDQPPPLDEDKFERLNRRRYDMHQRMLEAEKRRKGPTSEKYAYEDEDEVVMPKYYGNKKDVFYSPSEKEKFGSQQFDAFEEPKTGGKPLHPEFDFDDFEDTPRSNASSSKFNFEEHGFESDFISSPPVTSAGAPKSSSSFRFSNDFSDKDKNYLSNNNSSSTNNGISHHHPRFSPHAHPIHSYPHRQQQHPHCDPEANQTTPTQKLRFDDKVTISKFEMDQPSAFEDDFSKAEFVVFESEDKWNPSTLGGVEQSLNKKNNLRLNKRNEHIKKSESVNIFAKKVEDPFEDDDFFTSPNAASSSGGAGGNSGKGNGIPKEIKRNGENQSSSSFQWDNNFAKFDENM